MNGCRNASESAFTACIYMKSYRSAWRKVFKPIMSQN